jgi:hypothetical protein
VQELCSDDSSSTGSSSKNSFGDPLLDWIFLPQQPPPPSFDTTDMLDQVFDIAFRVPTMYFMVIEVSHEDQEQQQQTMLQPDHVVDSAVTKWAQETPDEEIPMLAQQIVEHGKKFLSHPDDDRRRLARRLTEVQPETLKHRSHKVRLPFGCRQNRCLMEAASQGLVSSPCTHAMSQLEHIAALETEMEERQELFLGLLWIYVGLLMLLLALVARRFRQNKERRHLKTRILQAIYSNPKLKADIEESLGESLGSVPPVSDYVLRLMSSGGVALKQKVKCLRRIQLVLFLFLTLLVVVAPFWVLPACILISAWRALLLICGPTPVRECTCCCCGATTSDAAQGNLTDVQACCKCCSGTGICAPGCADCCGGGSDPCTCCNDTGCCCYSKEENCCGGAKAYPGNRRTTVSCCDGCCCCGAKPGQLAAGTLSNVQACCDCCGGTGSCSCCSCCGHQNKQVFLKPKQAIYHGVPVQIV